MSVILTIQVKSIPLSKQKAGYLVGLFFGKFMKQSLDSLFFSCLILFVCILSAANPALASDIESGGITSCSKKLLSGFDIGYTVHKQSGSPVVAIWYPAKKKSKDVQKIFEYTIGTNKVVSNLSLDCPLRNGKYPVVIYSHGAAGCGLSSFFLCEVLARNGFVVLAPDFSDQYYASRIDAPVEGSQSSLKDIWRYIYSLRDSGLNKDAAKGREEYSYRPKELIQTLDLISKLNMDPNSRFYRRLNESKPGLVGHSFGAWTSLIVAGASPSYSRGEKIGCVVSLSSPVNQYVFNVSGKNDLAMIHCPVMFQYGAKEKLFANRQDDLYLFSKANSPKFLASIADCNHFDFSCGSASRFGIASDYLVKSTPRQAICNLTLAFFETYLKGKKPDRCLRQVTGSVDMLKSSF